ncbi:copper homeostasis operon regulatory protein [Acetobacterium woodii DSM 1030]|uniref:Copper homeostasis operon regulatory protein n=2 Tax=Acetobacterium woodii TaxID=33952 RepID=H6LED4_ACEWD|nr:copper homeostasis operon regulatory protein [Acetobacterium woodii DSM 1030]
MTQIKNYTDINENDSTTQMVKIDEKDHHHTHSKAVLNRLSKAIGHLESVRKMVESGRDCSEVLIQLSAVKAAINNTGKIILQDHLEHCIVSVVKDGDHQAIEEINKAINRFIK